MLLQSFIELGRQAIAQQMNQSPRDISAVLYYPVQSGYYGVFTGDGGSSLYTVKCDPSTREFSVKCYEYCGAFDM